MAFFSPWKKREGSRLGRKLLLLILLGSSFLTMLGTAAQLYVDYRAEMLLLHGQLDQIRLSRLPSLANSLWYLDEEQLLAQLDGMLELRDIRYARVSTPDGMDLLRGTEAPPETLLIQNYPLIFHGLERSERIGTLTIALDQAALHARLRDKVLVILVTQGVQIFLVSLIILYLVFRFIARHLWRMAEYAATLSLGNLPGPLVLDKRTQPEDPDEIDLVVDALNGMLENLKRDIRQRMEAEARLRATEGSLRDILDSMPSMLIAVDQDGRVTRLNRQTMAMTGLSLDAAEGGFFEDIFPDSPVRSREILDAMARNAPHKVAKVPQIREGATFFYDVTIYPLVSGGMRGAVIRLDDVTERVQLEEMMIQSEKMLSVGGLAAGMAHEINNPLAGILQNLQVLRNRLTEDLPANRAVAEELGFGLTQLREYLERRGCARMLDSIAESGQRAAKIVANMLSFSRKSTSRLASVDVRALLDRTVELASNDYNLKKQYDFRRIDIVREYENDTPLVPCEESKIQQVFFNLIQNGAQAMSVAGTANPRFVFRVRRDGENLRVEIEDNGPGMAEDVRRRIFEPFFTTKAVGEGTGLGLSVSYFIVVENHGGALEVDSAPGKGTVFTMTLPITPRVAVMEETSG
jgi:PAS domain S-box-containing protein